MADFGTKSYIVGSTNSLLLQQRDRYSDILINLDENSINITSPSLRQALQLSAADRRWIDFITQEVNDTWDESNPGRPKTMGYVGSEEFIRLQFEEYLLSLISSVKYHNHMTKYPNNPRMLLPHIEGDPSVDFAPEFVEYWVRTENYRLWSANTDSHLFDIVEPKHPCAGGLTIDDVQRRIAQQVQDLHLDERFAQGREALGNTLAAGKERASTMLNKLYSDMEGLRDAQRRKAEEARLLQDEKKRQTAHHERNGSSFSAVDLAKAQQTVQSVGVKAGAYMSSWASWAGEKRKQAGWGRSVGLGGLVGGRNKNRNTMSSTASDASSEKDLQMSRMSMSSTMTGMSENEKLSRHLTQSSFADSVLDGPVTSSGLSSPMTYNNNSSRPLSDDSLTSQSTRGIDSALVAGSPDRNGDVAKDLGSTSPPRAATTASMLTRNEAGGDDDDNPLSPTLRRSQTVPPASSQPAKPVGSKVMLRP